MVEVEPIQHANFIRVVPHEAVIYACSFCGIPYRARLRPSKKKGMALARAWFQNHVEQEHAQTSLGP